MSSSGFSIGSASASVSASIPENLGAGKTTTTKNASKAVTLSPTDQKTLEDNIELAKKMLGREEALNPSELRILSQFAADLIEKPEKADMVQALINRIKNTPKEKEPPLTAEDYAVNALGLFVRLMSKGHVEVQTINEKFRTETPLSYGECHLVDQVSDYNRFATEMLKAGVFDNSYINQAHQLSTLAKANAFKGFKDGDVLFYDIAGRAKYYGSDPGILDGAIMKLLGSNYCHVGIFYRDADGTPNVAEIQGGYTRHELKFGQMSYIKGKRVDPAKFTAAKLPESERKAAQEKVGNLIAQTASPKYNWHIGITMGQQLKCVFGHSTSKPDTQLGKVKVKDYVNLLCSEFAGVAMMEAFDKYNKELLTAKDKNAALLLSNPFSEYEDMTHLHPERLLVAMGPKQGTSDANSGWEDVPAVDINKMLPTLPGFPDLSYPRQAATK